MYCEEILKISKAENGFVLCACVPIKEEKKGKDMGCCISGASEGEVKYVVKDENELFAKIKEVLPKLDTTYTSQDAFDKAFKAATMED